MSAKIVLSCSAKMKSPSLSESPQGCGAHVEHKHTLCHLRDTPETQICSSAAHSVILLCTSRGDSLTPPEFQLAVFYRWPTLNTLYDNDVDTHI